MTTDEQNHLELLLQGSLIEHVFYFIGTVSLTTPADKATAYRLLSQTSGFKMFEHYWSRSTDEGKDSLIRCGSLRIGKFLTIPGGLIWIEHPDTFVCYCIMSPPKMTVRNRTKWEFALIQHWYLTRNPEEFERIANRNDYPNEPVKEQLKAIQERMKQHVSTLLTVLEGKQWIPQRQNY
jgi:hypothetical protein